MKHSLFAATLFLSPALWSGFAAAEQLVPAGSIIRCTVAEPKISSKTENIGDPVLCQVSHVEAYGRASFPYDAYLVGTFVDYKDPGHLVGKGWMELKFDRMITHNDSVVPVDVRVIDVPKYPVDKEGRIHGTGHAVRDTVEWLIPVLWPIDLINLPRRGPRPVLKAETRLTLKVLDDFGIPSEMEVEHRQALISRVPQFEQSLPQNEPAPQYQAPAPVQYQQPAQYQQQSYAPAPPTTVIYQNFAPQAPVYQPPPVVVRYPPPPPPMMYGYGPYGPVAYRGGYYAPY